MVEQKCRGPSAMQRFMTSCVPARRMLCVRQVPFDREKSPWGLDKNIHGLYQVPRNARRRRLLASGVLTPEEAGDFLDGHQAPHRFGQPVFEDADVSLNKTMEEFSEYEAFHEAMAKLSR